MGNAQRSLQGLTPKLCHQAHHEARRDQMDQQKTFNQIAPNNYIAHGLKHTKSDGDHFAFIPICPWLT